MKRLTDPLRLDVAAFTAEHGELSGAWPGTELPRLASLQTPPQDLPLEAIEWRAEGERVPEAGAEDQMWLRLAVKVPAWLTCQRCLQPWRLPLAVSTRLRFVRGEAQAEALDAESEDDVLALPRALDLRALAEDELLLALPLVPRHARCPEPLPMSAGEDELVQVADDEAHPFAALKALKTPKAGPSGR